MSISTFRLNYRFCMFMFDVVFLGVLDLKKWVDNCALAIHAWSQSGRNFRLVIGESQKNWGSIVSWCRIDHI